MKHYKQLTVKQAERVAKWPGDPWRYIYLVLFGFVLARVTA